MLFTALLLAGALGLGAAELSSPSMLSRIYNVGISLK